MTTRDRIVIMVVLALVAVVAGWMFVVSPKRSEASSLSTQVTSEQSQLTAAQGQVAAGMSARQRVRGSVRRARQARRGGPAGRRRPLADLPGPERGPGVARQLPRPAAEQRRSEQLELLSQLVAERRGLDRAASPGAAVGAAGLPTEQFTITLSGNYFSLSSFFNKLEGFVFTENGTLMIRGRLMTINAISLVPGPYRIPADHRERLGDDVHRPADRGHLRRRDARRPRADHPGAGLDFRILDRAARGGRHLGAAMSVPRNMLKELLERKLWPIALVLVIALVAVPVLLTKKAPTDIVTPPTGPLPYSSGTTLPAISVQTTPGNSKLDRQGPQPLHPAARRDDVDDRRHDPAVTTTTPTTSTGTTSVGSGSSSSGSRRRQRDGGHRRPRPAPLAGADLDHARAATQAGADRADRDPVLSRVARDHDRERQPEHDRPARAAQHPAEQAAADARRAGRPAGRPQRPVRGRAGDRGQRRRDMHPGSDRLRDPVRSTPARPRASPSRPAPARLRSPCSR